MRRISCAVLAFVVGGAVMAGVARAKDADAMVQDIEGIKQPVLDQTKRGDQAYVQEYMKTYTAFLQARADAIKAFVDAYPTDARAGKMRAERWMILARAGKMDEAQAEVDAYLKDPGHAGDAEALFMAAQLSVAKNEQAPGGDKATMTAAVERFIKSAPKDDRGAQLLYGTASDTSTPEGRAVAARIVKEYPGSFMAREMQGKLRLADAVGKPFELSFADAISGKAVDMKGLKGKVVVVDFWATWCGPCVGEMPAMKERYAKYKGQGVEFIGVSLDEKEGGLAKLKEFVATNGITWPQYYQGNGWESDFSSSWGIMSIPSVFVVDAEGNLATADGRGKLDALIPELIAKRDQGK